MSLGLPLLGLAAVSVLVGSQSAIVFAAMAVGGLVIATALLLRPGVQPPLTMSAMLGVLFVAIAGLAALRSNGTFPSSGPILAYGAVAAFVTVISARAALLSSR